ncbi:MAG: response regulator, partial [Planctomycetaceae bacterium]|nr:response regulator [Planctomycetaceae bacterium]
KEAERVSAFGEILDQSLMEILIYDARTLQFVHVNHGACENTGYSLDELRTMTPVDIKPEHTPESLRKILTPLLEESQSCIEFQTIHRRKNGSEYPVKIHLETSILDERPVFVATILDITEQLQAAEKIEELARFPDEDTNPVLRASAEGKLLYANAASEPLLSYWETQVDGLLPGEMNTACQHALELGENARLEKVIGLQTYAMTITPVLKENYVNIYGMDITSRKSAESANRAKSEFLANMSHELRTPMTAILGFSDILLDSEINLENKEAARTIKRNGECLIELINDILDLSKIEEGKIDVEQVECSPHQIVDDVATLMKVRADAKGFPLEVQFDGLIPETVSTDPTRLRQVLINIVGNAIKFTETGSVKIVTRFLNPPGQKSYLRFDVIDSGIGIDQSKADKIFLPFTQADGSTTRRFGGTGLGLAISKRLTELLGGKISVSSAIGQGSTFSITVAVEVLDEVQLLQSNVKPEASNREVVKLEAPVPKVEEAKTSSVNVENVEAENVTQFSQAPLDGCRILVAEDGLDNQRLIHFLLKKTGATITLVENGQIAFDLTTESIDRNEPFDVILMDMQMPVLDGYEATRNLRDHGYRGPIIALTAHAMSSDRQKCLDAGCDDYLTKPIDKKQLDSMVTSYANSETAVSV